MEGIIGNPTDTILESAPAKTRGRIGQKTALVLCISITLLTMVAELVASRITGSLMLYSDALHMLSHAGALFVSLVAAELATRKPNAVFPYGFRRVEVLAAFINGVGLGLFTLHLVYHGFERLFDQVVVQGPEMITVAVIGLVVNLLTAFILARAGLENINTRSAFLHLLADTFSSVAIVAGGIIIHYTQIYIIDALLSMVIAIVIGKWSWGLIKASYSILLDRQPQAFTSDDLEKGLKNQFPEIREVQEAKVRELSTDYHSGTLKLVIADVDPSGFVHLQKRIATYLDSKFSIREVCIQLDYDNLLKG